ncbi:MAG: hypothetical protein K5821_00515 [Nitrobacter sp.]|uniref:DUF6527 family protein n=1 Tax=Nitrobacter sp. TaxID=29420 RepID=UPI002610D7CE|nr:DUF6527 family protein [Nitrobacter sp.]MCV0384907.1 hypothetical protein [Nitrobacter sp.]
MTEVRTPQVTAQHIPEKSEFQDDFGIGRVPGSFRVNDPDSDGEQTFWYVCPCGCGSLAPLTVGNGFKPTNAGYATWQWDGSLDRPTLHPSVHHVGHWHGWLRNGVWESC